MIVLWLKSILVLNTWHYLCCVEKCFLYCLCIVGEKPLLSFRQLVLYPIMALGVRWILLMKMYMGWVKSKVDCFLDSIIWHDADHVFWVIFLTQVSLSLIHIMSVGSRGLCFHSCHVHGIVPWFVSQGTCKLTSRPALVSLLRE
jgi:hypothetical protein